MISDNYIDDDDSNDVADDDNADAGDDTHMPTQGLPPFAMTGSLATTKKIGGFPSYSLFQIISILSTGKSSNF